MKYWVYVFLLWVSVVFSSAVSSVFFSRLSVPSIVSVSSNLINGWMIPESELVVFNVTVEDAKFCVFSYMFSYRGDMSGWVSESMVKQGNLYVVSLNAYVFPQDLDCHVYYRIRAVDGFGRFAETSVSWFVIWNDP